MRAKPGGIVGNPVLIGIDAGTSVFKAVAFDPRTGAVLHTATRRMPVESPKPGWMETPPAALDRALRTTLRDIRNVLGPRWAQVCGMGVASQGGSSIFVDRRTGDARTPMILWNDGRSSAETQRIRTAKPRAWWRARLLNEWTPAGLGRLAWMRRHHKTVFDDARLLHVGAGEYLFHRLTGLWRQDAGNAIQIGSYNAARGALTGDMLALAGFSVDRVAPLRAGHETAPLSADFARAAALRAGIPVVGPYIDQEAALQSVQGVGARPLQCSLGTAWVGNFSLPARAVGAAAMQFVLRGGDARARTVVLPLLTGNTAWDWALSRFVDADPRKALCAAEELLAAQLLPPAGMVCVPWLLQGNPEGAQEAGACTFHGVGPRATTHDFVRAVACGLCFELLRVFAQAKEGKRVDAVILSGGASKSARFRELISTLFAPLPAYVQQNEDTAAARGALIAFSDRMAKSPVSRIAAARGARARAITDAYRQYLRVFATVYGDHPLAAPYAFTKEGK